MRVLVMGLPGAGKTTLAQSIKNQIGGALWLNADRLRSLHNDWDFSSQGRIRQAMRIRKYADVSEDPVVIADFVCPTPEMRDIYNADITVWIDTISKGRFEDTNKAFVAPEKFDFRITDYNPKWIDLVMDRIKHENCCKLANDPSKFSRSSARSLGYCLTAEQSVTA